MGVLQPDPRTCELTLTAVHPEVDVDTVRAATSWELAVTPDLRVTLAPTVPELAVLRGLGVPRPRELAEGRPSALR